MAGGDEGSAVAAWPGRRTRAGTRSRSRLHETAEVAHRKMRARIAASWIKGMTAIIHTETVAHILGSDFARPGCEDAWPSGRSLTAGSASRSRTPDSAARASGRRCRGRVGGHVPHAQAPGAAVVFGPAVTCCVHVVLSHHRCRAWPTGPDTSQRECGKLRHQSSYVPPTPSPRRLAIINVRGSLTNGHSPELGAVGRRTLSSAGLHDAKAGSGLALVVQGRLVSSSCSTISSGSRVGAGAAGSVSSARSTSRSSSGFRSNSLSIRTAYVRPEATARWLISARKVTQFRPSHADQ